MTFQVPDSFTERAKTFEESIPLVNLAKQIIDLNLPQLVDARGAKYHILFTNQESTEHYGGKCKKVEGATSYHTKLDFIIVVYKSAFMNGDLLEKIRILVHELYHIGRDASGKFKLRKHEGDFCELEPHDKFSFLIASDIIPRLVIPEEFRD
jgi:hypothetical protein